MPWLKAAARIPPPPPRGGWRSHERDAHGQSKTNNGAATGGVLRLAVAATVTSLLLRKPAPTPSRSTPPRPSRSHHRHTRLSSLSPGAPREGAYTRPLPPLRLSNHCPGSLSSTGFAEEPRRPRPPPFHFFLFVLRPHNAASPAASNPATPGSGTARSVPVTVMRSNAISDPFPPDA